MKKLLAFITMFLLIPAAQAAPISVSQLTNQTVVGENFNFNFLGLAASDGTGGTFTLHAQGDYDGRDDETLTWDIDGLLAAGPVGGFCSTGITAVCTSPNGAANNGGVGGPFDFVNVVQPLGNVEFQRTYTLDALTLDAILADGMANIFVDLANNIGFFNPPNFVEVTLSYESRSVPVTGTLALFALGLLGLGFKRRGSHAS